MKPNSKLRLNEVTAWLLVVVWMLFIYAAIPFARRIQAWCTAHLGGREVFTSIVLFMVVLGGGLGALFLVRRLKGLAWTRLVVLLAVAGAYTYGTLKLRDSPEEALHFVEYGVLALLLVRAFLFRVKDPAVYLCAGLAALFLGLIDEVIQWMVPDRFWDWRDLAINSIGSLLMFVAIAGGLQPSSVQWRYNPRTLRMAVRLAVVLLLAMACCFLNTPGRTEIYAEAIPGLGFLKGNQSVMTEYGYFHEAPAIGGFYSRMTLDALAAQDARRDDEVGRILTTWRDHNTYPAFLKRFPSHRDPFLHELRVHLFRRDHHIGMYSNSMKQRDLEKAAKHATIAYREQQLLDAYFGNSLAKSPYRLTDDARRWLALRADKESRYVSPVSKNLFVLFTDEQIVGAIALGLAILCVLHVRLGIQVRGREST